MAWQGIIWVQNPEGVKKYFSSRDQGEEGVGPVEATGNKLWGKVKH